MNSKKTTPDRQPNSSPTFKQNTRNNSQENLKENDLQSQPSPQNATVINTSVPVAKWGLDKTLDWFAKKFPSQFETYKHNLMQNNVNGEILLDLNYNCLDQLNINDSNFREQLLEEIALLKIKNEYEFIKRFKAQV